MKTFATNLKNLFESTKPELTGLSAVSAFCGYYLGSGDMIDWQSFLILALGTWLIAGAAGSLNEYIEREYDGWMNRTKNRPIPSGRTPARSVLLFGSGNALIGLCILFLFVRPISSFLGLATLIIYLLVYTPLKRISPVATPIGAVAGAIPPLIGWSGAAGQLTLESFVLFLILYLWQLPHFFSLGFMYKDDYAHAGFRFLATHDDSGIRTSVLCTLMAAALIPTSLIFLRTGNMGWIYGLGSFVLGALYFLSSLSFLRRALVFREAAEGRRELRSRARRVFLVSISYLPMVMVLMVIDKQ